MLFTPPLIGLTSNIPAIGSHLDLIRLNDIHPNTFQAYLYNINYCDQWLKKNGFVRVLPLHHNTILQWLTELVQVERKTATTIKQRRSALSWLHDINGYKEENNPCQHHSLLRIGFKTKRLRKHAHLTNAPTKKTPLRLTDIKNLVQQCADNDTGKRDKAILLIGFAGAMRRSELVHLHTKNLKRNPDDSLTITIGNSKTDKLAEGQTVTIHPNNDTEFCPIAALDEWLATANIHSGFLFPGFTHRHPHLSPKSVGNIIKKYCALAGLNPDLFAGHSLRRGLLITAAEKGAGINELRVHARHTRSTMTEEYIGQSAFNNKNPTKMIW